MEIVKDFNIDNISTITNCYHIVVVIDSHTFGCIEISIDSSNIQLKNLFFTLILYIDSIIYCRAFPAQKAFIV